MKRQFIAGAVCPACQRMDRIVIEQDEGERIRRCVACGFADEILPAAGVVPDSRLIRPAAEKDKSNSTERSKVRIVGLDPAGLGSEARMSQTGVSADEADSIKKPG